MDAMKRQIEYKMTASILADKCLHHDGLLFQQSWCTQDRVLRFTTNFFRKLLPVKGDNGGQWDTGDFAMYCVYHFPDKLRIDCTLAWKILPKKLQPAGEKLKAICKAKNIKSDTGYILGRWELEKTENINELFSQFDSFLIVELPVFEAALADQLQEKNQDDTPLTEGSIQEKISLGYERNPIARQKCIEANGTACTVCGMDFGKVYGPEFEGKIEVHHIAPLSTIRTGHVVDPVRDLIPVCPNCHTALHSKKNGVYTVQEIREFMDRLKA